MNALGADCSTWHTTYCQVVWVANKVTICCKLTIAAMKNAGFFRARATLHSNFQSYLADLWPLLCLFYATFVFHTNFGRIDHFLTINLANKWCKLERRAISLEIFWMGDLLTRIHGNWKRLRKNAPAPTHIYALYLSASNLLSTFVLFSEDGYHLQA